MDEHPALPGYKITGKIGEGGMATVYAATQLGLDRPVAIKFLDPALALDENYSRRFMREAKIVGQLSHAHIVPVYEVGEHNGQFFLSMEQLNGGDLRQAIDQGLTEKTRQDYLKQVLLALRYAHKRGFVHRDIKPDNILLRDSENAVVTDFGIAREIEPDGEMTTLTKVQTIIGSPKFMSPEQTRGDDLDHRTDLYSLGVVAWILLTGNHPHDGKTIVELAINRNEVPLPKLPEQLRHWQGFVNGLLAYEKDNRFADCDAALAALDKLSLTQNEQRLDRVDDDKTLEKTEVSPINGPRNRRSVLETTIVDRQGQTSATAQATLVQASQTSNWRKGALISLVAVFMSAFTWLWLTAPALKPSPTQQAPTQPSPDRLVDTSEPSFSGSDPASNSTPSGNPIQSLVAPEPIEYFAFRDALDSSTSGSPSARTEAFLETYPNGVLAQILRVYTQQDAPDLAALQKLASGGDPASQLVLSDLYANGWQVAKNAARARQLAEDASGTNRPFANFQLASLLLNETPRADRVSPRVSKLLTDSADTGFYLAQTSLATLHFYGQVTGRSETELSIRLFKRAAAQGDRNALQSLATIFEQGLGGIPADPDRADAYLRKAAALGY